MQRMELYTSGVKVPKLGSSLDVLSRAYLTHKLNRETTLAKLLAYSAASLNKDGTDIINSVWRNYINLSYFMDDINREKESQMYEYYQKIKNHNLQAKSVGIGDNKTIVISGLPKELYE